MERCMPSVSIAPRSFGEKVALEVTRGGIGSRALASTLGHVGSFPVMTLLSHRSHVNPTQWQGASGSIFDKEISPDDERAQKHKRLAEAMAKVNPQELKDTLVYLGGPNLINEYKRLYKNPRSSLLGKVYSGAMLPLNLAMLNIARGSAYHPMTDSVYLMGDKPGVLTHELGHALDFNRFAVPKGKPGESKFKSWLRRQGYGLGRDLYAASRALPVVGGLAAIPQEAAANNLSLKNIQQAYKDDPEALNKLLADRQKVLPAGMGSYLGGAAAGLIDPTGLLQAPLAVGGALAGKIYGVAQNAGRGGEYRDAPDADTAEILQLPTKKKPEAEPHRKAANDSNFFNDYAHYFNKLYNPEEHGMDVRLPHDYTALRQMLISGTVGGAMGLGRGMLWPGYVEKKDEQGRIVAKRKRSPLLGAIEGAAIGAGTSALSNYAGQTLSKYNPEIDDMLHKAKDTLVNLVPSPTRNPNYGIDINPTLMARVQGMA
jgi:hypothetical protein